MTLKGHLFSAPLDIDICQVNTALIRPPDITEVIPSIGQLGVLQSVLLKLSGNPEYPYEIVDGDRRVNSALRYHLDTIPAIITDGTRGQIAAASAILNAARSNNPIDEARSWKIALEEGQFGSVAELGKHVHIGVQTIKKRLKLLTLPEDILVHVGVSVAEGVAEKMANLPADYQADAVDAALRQLDAGKKFTAADLKLSQTRRVEDREDSIDALFDLSPLPLLEIAHDPIQELATEVQRLCQARNVPLEQLLDLLRPTPSLPLPAPPARPNRPPATVRDGRVNLGLRN
jgi:ParB family chromosome partitioning protein